jgi:hypothetical protein
MEAFRKSLRRSGRESVDDFLSDRPEFSFHGKRMIGEIIGGNESEELLFDADRSRSWLHILWQRMIDDCTTVDDLPVNDVSFIVFNYDRCVEHFLTVAIAERFGLTPEVAWEKVRQIPIVHPHGVIAHYSPSEGHRRAMGATHACFGSVTSGTSKESSPQTLRLYWEGSTDNDAGDRKKANDILTAANTAYFLGFGFIKQNIIRVLSSLSSNRGCTLYATCLGMTNAEKRRARGQLDPLGQRPIHFSDCDARSLLRERI